MSALGLIDVHSKKSWFVQYDPQTIKTMDRINWEAQDTSIGVKPLFYANTEPRSLSFPELIMDNTDTNESLTDKLQELKDFVVTEQEDRGAPPTLLATWGDRKELVVLRELSVEEIFFDTFGVPLRARLSMEFLQVQDEDFVGVNVGN